MEAVGSFWASGWFPPDFFSVSVTCSASSFFFTFYFCLWYFPTCTSCPFIQSRDPHVSSYWSPKVAGLSHPIIAPLVGATSICTSLGPTSWISLSTNKPHTLFLAPLSYFFTESRLHVCASYLPVRVLACSLLLGYDRKPDYQMNNCCISSLAPKAAF